MTHQPHHLIAISWGDHSDYQTTTYRVLRAFTAKDLVLSYWEQKAAENFPGWLCKLGYIEDANIVEIHVGDDRAVQLDRHDESITFPFTPEGEPPAAWIKPAPRPERAPTTYIGRQPPPQHVNCRAAPIPQPEPPRHWSTMAVRTHSEREIRRVGYGHGALVYRKRGAHMIKVCSCDWVAYFNVDTGLVTGRKGTPGTVFTEQNRDLDREDWYRTMLSFFYALKPTELERKNMAAYHGGEDDGL